MVEKLRIVARPLVACAFALTTLPGAMAHAQDTPADEDEPARQLSATGEALAQAATTGETDTANANDGELGAAAEADASIGSRQVYTPADFAAFSPRSALDMIEQLPGFTIDGGLNFGNRGLGQAAGNVLLNGVRIATKSGSITDELARIPATSRASVWFASPARSIQARGSSVTASRATSGLSGSVRRSPPTRCHASGAPAA